MTKETMETNGVFDDDLSCRMYDKAKKFGPADLEKSSLESIIKKTPNILTSKSFLTMSSESLSGILQDKNLRVQNELQLFKLLMRIGNHKCSSLEMESNPENLRNLLKDLIPLIRFPMMEEQDFQNYVRPSQLLEKDQLDSMMKWWERCHACGFRNPSTDGIMFSTKTRKYIEVEEGNICATTTRFAEAMKTLEDFSSSGLYSGNVNVVQLDHILSQMQKYALTLFQELKTTQNDLKDKTERLESLLQKSQKKTTAHIEKVNAELQGTKIQLTNTQYQLEGTKGDLEKTKVELELTKIKLTETKKNLQKEAKSELENVKQNLQAETQSQASKTKSEFEETHKKMKENHKELTSQLQETNKLLQDTRAELQSTKKALEKTTSDLHKTKTKLLDTKSELDVTKKELMDTNSILRVTKENLQNTRTDLEKTGEDLQKNITSMQKTTRTKIQDTNVELESNKAEFKSTQSKQETKICQLENKLEETEARLEDTKSNLEEMESKTESRIQKLNSKLTESKDKLQKMKQTCAALRMEIKASNAGSLESLVSDLIPVGFIYVQFPKQLDPIELWPLLEWLDVTDDYAGVFFRALGGSSASFNVVQGQDVPRVAMVTTKTVRCLQNARVVSQVLPERAGSTEDHIFTGNASKCGACTGDSWGMQFHVLGTEVRPRNMAIRVWQRIDSSDD